MKKNKTAIKVILFLIGSIICNLFYTAFAIFLMNAISFRLIGEINYWSLYPYIYPITILIGVFTLPELNRMLNESKEDK